MPALKTIDIADDTTVIVNGSTINYAEGGYRYMVRFPAKPSVATITDRGKGRRSVALGNMTRTTVVVNARADVAEAIFVAAGGLPAS